MPFGETTGIDIEATATQIVDAIYHVHRVLGPGLLELIYEKCLAIELERRGLTVERQVMVPVIYQGVEVEPGLRLDLLVNGCVVVEVKAVDALHPVHKAQLLTYLKLSERRLGILANFNVAVIKDGIKRVIR